MADFTPTWTDWTDPGPFRYWAQKVLPLVYDDSLSYYEVLCKVVSYLNTTITNVAALGGNVEGLRDAYTQLQQFVNDYFDNLDVQQEINAKLDNMAETGALTELLQPFIDTQISTDVSSWLERNITPTSPAVDASLTIEGAAADAKVVGNEITGIKKDISDIETLFETNQTSVTETAHNGYRWNINGTLVEYSTATAWEFVAEPVTNYIVQGITVGTNTMMPILFLDASNNIISTISNAVQEAGHKVPFKTPVGCTKVRYTTATNATWDIAPVKLTLKSLADQTPILHNTQKIAALEEDVSDLKQKVIGEYPLTWIANEYVVTATGEFAHYNGWKRTDYVDISDTKKINITNTGTANNNNCWYDENKNRVGYFNNATDSLIVPDNAKYLCLSIESSANITVNADKNEETEMRLSAIESEYMPEIPSYYEAHIVSKINSIRVLESTGSVTGDKFIFVTDQHYPRNTGHSPSLIQKIMRETGARFIISGGDINNSADGVPAMKDIVHGYINQIKNAFPMLNVIGNHEWYTNVIDPSKTRPTESDLYSTMQKYAESEYISIGALDSFIFDNTIQKIRYIIVSCDFDTKTTTDQIEWFLSELAKIPNGYTLIVIGHAFMADSMAAIRSSHVDFCNGLDALKANGSYTYNGTTYDYSTKDVTIACIITGHTHIDGTLLTQGGIRIICTTTDSAELNYELVNGTPTLSARTKNTVDEQAFDVFSIDTSAKTINITRIGYGSDRNYTF